MATIKIPESVCIAIAPHYEHDPEASDILRTIRASIKAMIEAAIHDGLPPAKLPVVTEGGVSMNITFAAKEDKSIRHLARADSIREGDAALKYLYAAMARGDVGAFRTETLSFMRGYTDLLNKEHRHHQNVFAEYLFESLQSNQIGLIEAATGVGKSLAMVVACVEALKGKTFGRCVIAVPTIQLLRQFAKQHRELEDAGVADMPPARFVVGRAEFVCAAELKAVIRTGTELIDPAPIEQWLAAGGPARGNSVDLQSCYLLDSLRDVSPAFPVEAVRLGMDSEPDDPGAKAYAAQFERDADEETTREIIYCTHAMIAADLRRRLQAVRKSDVGQDILDETRLQLDTLRAKLAEDGGQTKENGKSMSAAIKSQIEALATLASSMDVGLLPPWQHILIDEAHAFESNLANLMSSSVSLGRYVRHLGEIADAGIISQAAYKRAKNALNLIRNRGRQDEYDLATRAPVADEFRAALQEMGNAFLSGRKPSGSHPLLTLVRVQANTIMAGLRSAIENRGSRSLLCYSPIRAFPQLNVGRHSVQSELSFLWQTASSGACVSATLYLRKLDKDSAAYSASVLNIPQLRQREYPVVRPAWTHDPVVGLWTPEARKIDGHYWLRPPSRRDKLTPEAYARAEAAWLDESAEAVKGIYATAAGGVLILMGSYSAAEGLAERLHDHVDLKVVASQRHSLFEQMSRFAEYGVSGRKAIWIGVGGAWTGVDVNGANYGITDPTNDNLMTDIVIPRLPFGLNRSMTHKTRVDGISSIPWELLETAMRFKQGTGRLVRRPGLPRNRRIFVLDGRCNDPVFENYLAHLRRIMGAYPQKILMHGQTP